LTGCRFLKPNKELAVNRSFAFVFDLLISPPRTNAAEIIIKFLIMYCPSNVEVKYYLTEKLLQEEN
jgi:hypothetical protein